VNLLEAITEEMVYLGYPGVRIRGVLDQCGSSKKALRKFFLAWCPRRRMKRLGMQAAWVYPINVPFLIERMSEAGLDISRALPFMWIPVETIRTKGLAVEEGILALHALVPKALAQLGQEWVTTKQVFDLIDHPHKTLAMVGRVLYRFTYQHKVIKGVRWHHVRQGS